MQIPISFQTFAIKSFNPASIEARHVESEVEMLKRFNGHMHPHLVTLLATYTHRDIHHLIFPWAECDLSSYWENNAPPSTADDVLWLSAQALSLASALDLTHNPPSEDGSTRLHGRHGDIKPENILWFKSTNDSKGILVISDWGLSSMNSKKSRSNVPNKFVGFTPAYRPPESDIEDGSISRSSDIWSLGCLFLEMISWMLGGWPLVERFTLARVAPSTMGFNTDSFFDILPREDSELKGKAVIGDASTDSNSKPRVFQVKKQVTEVCIAGGRISTSCFLTARD